MDIKISKASESDIDKIVALIRPFAQKGIILSRDANEIRENLDYFLLAHRDKDMCGVISYYDYGPTLKEIRTLVVSSQYSGQRIGSRLLKELISKLNIEPAVKIFALSYSPEFFIKNGFEIVDKETLPEKIWKDCSMCKNRDKCGETALVFKKNG